MSSIAAFPSSVLSAGMPALSSGDWASSQLDVVAEDDNIGMLGLSHDALDYWLLDNEQSSLVPSPLLPDVPPSSSSTTVDKETCLATVVSDASLAAVSDGDASSTCSATTTATTASPAPVTSHQLPVPILPVPQAITSLSTKRRRPVEENCIPSDIPKEEQERLKRERNKRHARLSRQRKKNNTAILQHSVQKLQQMNASLRQDIAMLLQTSVQEIDRMVEFKKQQKTLRFVDQLQKPENRQLDAKTLKFLRKLSKSVSKM